MTDRCPPAPRAVICTVQRGTRTVWNHGREQMSALICVERIVLLHVVIRLMPDLSAGVLKTVSAHHARGLRLP